MKPTLSTLTICILMDFQIHIDILRMGLPILYFKGLRVVVSKLRRISVLECCFNLSKQCRIIILMKCRILPHFIWVFTVCQSTPHLGVSTIHRVKGCLHYISFMLLVNPVVKFYSLCAWKRLVRDFPTFLKLGPGAC